MLYDSVAWAWLFMTSLAILILGVMGEPWKVPFIAIIGCWNLVTFLVYWWDKHMAKHDHSVRWRIPERVLWLLLWWAGLLGAWLGMSMCKHKTKKSEFRNPAFLLTVFNGLWLCLYFLIALDP
eukprot:g10218.t1